MNVQETIIKVYSGPDLIFSCQQPAADFSSESGSAALVQTLKFAKAQVNQCLTEIVENSAPKRGKGAAHSEDGSDNEESSDSDEGDKSPSSKQSNIDSHSKRKLDCVGANESILRSGVEEAEEKRVKS